MKADQERVSKLLTDTVTLLCKNGLIYSQEIKVQGLLGITLDKNDVFIVHINETIGGGTSKEASPAEGSRRKTAGAPTGSNFVDLTRLTDTPMVSLNSMQGSARKQRPSSMLPPQMPPHMMAARGGGGGMQYMNPGMHPRGMRMNNAAMHSAVAQQMGNHMMYTPRGGGPPMMMPNMRGYNTSGRGGGVGSRPRHTVQMIPSAVSAMNEDEDVMIVGTGHEDPNWKNNAMRRPPILQPQPRRRLAQPPTLNAQPNRHMSNVPPGLSTSLARNQSTPNGIGGTKPSKSGTAGVGGGQIIVSDNSSPMGQIIIQPSGEESASDRTDVDDVSGSGYQPEFVLLNSIGGVSFDGGVEDGSDSDLGGGMSKETDGGEGGDEPPRPTMIYSNVSVGELGDAGNVLPVVYTDIADPPSASLSSNNDESNDMNIEAPGFDVLTAEDDDHYSPSSATPQFPSGEEGFDTWTCRFANCAATFTKASHLANHYTVQHSTAVDITPPSGTVIPPPITARYGGRHRGDGGSADGHQHSTTRQKEVCCPFGGCSALFSSYPGLYMHHKRVHGAAISKDVRRVLRKRYGVKGTGCVGTPVSTGDVLLTDLPVDDPNPGRFSPVVNESPAVADADDKDRGGNEEDAETDSVGAGGSPTKNFLCLFSECETSCTSREKLVEHLQSCHGSMDGMVAGDVEMKEEEEEN